MNVFNETTFVKTDGSAFKCRYPPPFKFAAISYHWQKLRDSDWWDVPVNNKSGKVEYQASVGAFYQDHFSQLLKWVEKELGNKYGIHHVWIDAICIDQKNEAAKVQQLPGITWLFNQAECIVAAPWLAHKRGSIGVVQMYDIYMQRCWVIAEISAGKSVFYTHWDGRNMYAAQNDPKAEGFCPPGSDPKKMDQTEKDMHLNMSNRVVMLRGQKNFGSFHVDEVVKIALELDATKEKDKLYALMPTAGKTVRRTNQQMGLQDCIMHFMDSMKEPIDRLRLAMGVSRFPGHLQARAPSWSFGQGAKYNPPWARNEYLENPLDASVKINNDSSLTFTGKYYECQLSKGAKTSNSLYYAGECNPVLPDCSRNLVFYHPQLDREKQNVILCRFGLDQPRRVLGIVVDKKSQTKIGIFFVEAGASKCESWTKGSVIIK